MVRGRHLLPSASPRPRSPSIIPGEHTLRIYALDPGVVLDKLVLDFGGLMPTYLGPPANE